MAPRKSASKRRTQAERRRATQEAILRAAIDLLYEEGYARFSTIAVAKRAGVSRGARENYYRTKNELLLAAGNFAHASLNEQARKLAERAETAADPVRKFLDDSGTFFFSRTYMAMTEIAMAARTDPEVERVFLVLFNTHRRALDRIWTDSLRRAGFSHIEVARLIRMTHYLMRGMALRSVWDNRRGEFREVMDEWHRLVPHYLAMFGPRPAQKAAATPARTPRKHAGRHPKKQAAQL
jgi:AcrR family transcriptional regulator